MLLLLEPIPKLLLEIRLPVCSFVIRRVELPWDEQCSTASASHSFHAHSEQHEELLRVRTHDAGAGKAEVLRFKDLWETALV
jgi:hypothetical protein